MAVDEHTPMKEPKPWPRGDDEEAPTRLDMTYEGKPSNLGTKKQQAKAKKAIAQLKRRGPKLL
jgi:hypothetical protein